MYRVSAWTAALVAPRLSAVTWRCWSGTGSQGTWRCLSRGVLRVSAVQLLLEFSNKTKSAATVAAHRNPSSHKAHKDGKLLRWGPSQGWNQGCSGSERLPPVGCVLKPVTGRAEAGAARPAFSWDVHSPGMCIPLRCAFPRDVHSCGCCSSTSLSTGTPGCCPLLAHIPLPGSCRPAHPASEHCFPLLFCTNHNSYK